MGMNKTICSDCRLIFQLSQIWPILDICNDLAFVARTYEARVLCAMIQSSFLAVETLSLLLLWESTQLPTLFFVSECNSRAKRVAELLRKRKITIFLEHLTCVLLLARVARNSCVLFLNPNG